MIRFIFLAIMAFSFTAAAQIGPQYRPGHDRSERWERHRDRQPPARRPRPPQEVVNQVASFVMPYNDQWVNVWLDSCRSRYSMNGDQILFQMENYALAHVEEIEIVFGDRRGNRRQRINTNKWTFREAYSNTGWIDLRGSFRRDRCIQEIWVWGKSVRVPPRGYRDRAEISVWLKDIREAGQR